MLSRKKLFFKKIGFILFSLTVILHLSKISFYKQENLIIKIQREYIPNDCLYFFHGSPWPIPRANKNSKDLAKLCQNEEKERISSKAVFATLYDTNHKIPVYSASRLLLNYSYDLSRIQNDDSLWQRMSLSLCQEPPSEPVMSRISKVDGRTFPKCEKHQASNRDYTNNDQYLTRGHLEPRNTNNNERTREQTTYTLTNAAPQYENFNGGLWEKIECLTKELIIRLAPNQPVYVVTGTESDTQNKNGDKTPLLNGRVLVPDYFWKAVCYPKSTISKGWGFAVIMRNTQIPEPMSKHDFLKKFETLNSFLGLRYHEQNSLFGFQCKQVSNHFIRKELNIHWKFYENRCQLFELL